MSAQQVLVTGATGKVGRHFLRRFLADARFGQALARALCHQRTLPPAPRLVIARGTIADRDTVCEAMRGITHVVHLATCKETPLDIMDVAIKGLFWLLEECRQSQTFRQFILIGGDAGMGHFFYPHPIPVTETQEHSAYPGCYALSKVLEEVMMEQYAIQYDLNVCCLRAPWIMEKDDFKYQLSFGDDVFGGPRWRDLVGPALADEYMRSNTVPVMLDTDGEPVLRNFVHVDDLVDAILAAIDHPKARQQTFNICMDEPINYRAVADHLRATRGMPSVDITTPYRSTWLDNAKARFLLGWRPKYDLQQLTDEAFSYQRGPDDPRTTWYPG
ncbi:MAG: NAD(P)-dependent oxidoreductase [Planctomycetes bacterium]|nr:NAD(P)-dependent oxidoreductase [Planctomycetota bacterium]